MYTVGGIGDAEISTLPSLDRVMTLGGEGCGCCDGSNSAVGMEYAWTDGLNVVVKYRIRESGEKSKRRGSPCIACESTNSAHDT
jgi:hypothetical protein